MARKLMVEASTGGVDVSHEGAVVVLFVVDLQRDEAARLELSPREADAMARLLRGHAEMAYKAQRRAELAREVADA
jgi:hypothetical protein